VLVLTLGSGVDGFTLDPDTGRFLHTHKDIRIPATGPIYSFNEANFHDFEEPVKQYLEALKTGSNSVGVRYVASPYPVTRRHNKNRPHVTVTYSTCSDTHM
jgi:fructose-1,6-bisphosphatase I